MRQLLLTALLAACPGPEEPGEPVCTPGADQTCNLDPAISSLHGRCEDDGTCTCLDGYAQDEATGLCR